MDLDASYAVYLGAWTNWSRGRVLGATYTLTRRDANLLIAFVAIFVAFVGALVLRFVCSRQSQSNGLYFRTKAGRIQTQCLPPLGVAVTCFVGFILASGLSRIATVVSSEVLMSGVNCSLIRDTNNMSHYGGTIGSMIAQNMIAAENYARLCYSSTPALGVGCEIFVKKQLAPAVVNTDASCPFDPKICKNASSNLFIDTGLLDSNDDFGRNSPPNKRLQLRQTVHCAPLATEGYRFRTYEGDRSFTTYYYGPMQDVNWNATKNYTSRFSNDVYPDIEELTHHGIDTVHDFSVRYHYSGYFNNSREPWASSFFPIPELKPENGTVSIYFLTSGRILFTSPSDDGWYGGTTNTTLVHKLKFSSVRGNATFYRQNGPGAPLGCREQTQVCYTGVTGQKCTPLQNPKDSHLLLHSILAEEEDRPWLHSRYAFGIAPLKRLYDPLQLLGTRVLMARTKLSGPILGPLPDNQWQLEIQHWHATTMAYLQYLFIRPIIGFEEPKYAGMLKYPTKPEHWDECNNQKIVDEGFLSVSIFALVCIFFIGGIVIVLSYVPGPRCLSRSGRYQYVKLGGSSNSAFQLHTMGDDDHSTEYRDFEDRDNEGHGSGIHGSSLHGPMKKS